MNATISPWGNSLGFRIPKVIAEALQFTASDKIVFTIKDESLIIKKEKNSLNKLLKNINSDNIHKETQTSHIAGNEVW